MIAALLFSIAITNVHVVPMTDERVLRNQVVLVDEGRIVSVTPADSAVIPPDATRIDGENGFLIPGLIDLHAHLGHGSEELFTANGVTTILLAGDGADGLALRKEISRTVPTVIACGPSITGVATPAEAERIVAEQKAAGYDCIKIYDDIEAAALPALVDAARKREMLSIGHVPRNLTWQQMIAAKPDAIAHLEEFLYSPVLQGEDYVIAGQLVRNDVAVISTLTTYDRITRQVADLDRELARAETKLIAPEITEMWKRAHNPYRTMKAANVPNMRRLLAFQKSLAKTLHDAGGRLLMGTDAGGPPFVLPGFSATDELRLLVSAGLTPYQALRAATSDAAKFIRRPGLGTIAPGNVADLVLLRGNPLTDIENVDLRAGVMVRGKWLSSH